MIGKAIGIDGLLSDSELGLLYGIMSVSCMIFTHHCGLAQSICWLNYCYSTILCIIFYSATDVTWWSSMSMLFTLLAVAVCLACEDYELRQSYIQHKSREAAKGERDSNPEDNARGYSKGLSYVMKLVNDTHTQLFDALSSSGSLDPKGPINTLGTYYQQSRLLCHAVLLSSMSKEGLSEYQKEKPDDTFTGPPHGVYLSKLLLEIFSLCEISAGTALPFYASADSPDLFSMTNKNLYEVLLYLLIGDAVGDGQGREPSGGICSVGLSYSSNRWVLRVQIAMLVDREPAANMFNAMSSLEVGQLHSSIDRLIYNDQDELDPENEWSEGLGMFLSGESGRKTSYHSPLTRLAHTIVGTHLDDVVTVESPEVSQGIVFHRRSFPLPTNAPLRICGHSMLIGTSQTWVIIEQHFLDESVVQDLKTKLDMLKVPVKVCKGIMEYKILGEKNNVVVITETAIKSFDERLRQELITLSDSRVVLCSTAIDMGRSVEQIEKLYQITNVSMLGRMSPLIEVFKCVQLVTRTHRPLKFRRHNKVPSGDQLVAKYNAGPVGNANISAQSVQQDVTEESKLSEEMGLVEQQSAPVSISSTDSSMSSAEGKYS